MTATHSWPVHGLQPTERTAVQDCQESLPGMGCSLEAGLGLSQTQQVQVSSIYKVSGPKIPYSSWLLGPEVLNIGYLDLLGELLWLSSKDRSGYAGPWDPVLLQAVIILGEACCACSCEAVTPLIPKLEAADSAAVRLSSKLPRLSQSHGLLQEWTLALDSYHLVGPSKSQGPRIHTRTDRSVFKKTDFEKPGS